MNPRAKPETTSTITANQLVAYNLRRARENCELTQDQAAERLEPFLGTKWSRATFSAAETSITSGRPREFTANEILAFARAFGQSVDWFFYPPVDDTSAISCGGPTEVSIGELLDSAIPWPRPGAQQRAAAAISRLPADQRSVLENKLREGGLARVDALATAEAGIRETTRLAADLRRIANAIEGAEDAAKRLFTVTYFGDADRPPQTWAVGDQAEPKG